MKTSARVVVVGGGMMGASLLYHLALEGCSDTVLIEKGELTSGSTWHAAGQCPSITGSYNLAKIHAYSNTLYPKLEALTGQYVSWHPCGGLRLANNRDELAWLKFVQGYSKSIGFSMDIVGLEDIKRLNPFLTTDRVIAAAWTRDDGHGDPSGLCNALAKAARDLGASVVRRNRVLDIRPRPSGEWEVITEKGSIIAEMVVNAAGCYARQVAAMVGADAPIANMQHHYVVTHPIPAFMERSEEIPVMRDSYTSGYFRQEQKSGLMGVYESTGLHEAWAPRGVPEWESSNELFADDLDRIAPWLERAIERMPIFGEVGIRRVINGAIPHTPDGAPLLGPAAGLKNFWMCCGTSFGIAQGGGCGKYLAQWMLHGDAEINMTEFDPRRFGGFADAAYVRDKVFLDYRLTFTTRRPGEEEMAGRPRKISPLHERLQAQGCVHTETFGWERPKWFSLDGRAENYGYGRNNVFEVVAAEVAAVHERVGVLDLTGFAKYDISGAGAEAFLNRVCANQVPRKAGGIALVHLLSPGGRIQGEMTLTRLADDRFYALSAAAAELRDQDLLTQSLLPGEQVRIANVTADRGVLVSERPAFARAAGSIDRCGSREPGLSVASGPGDFRCRTAGAGAARELRGRAWLGIASTDGIHARFVRWHLGSRAEIGNRKLWTVRGQHPAHGKGLQGMVQRAHQRVEHAGSRYAPLHSLREAGFYREGGHPPGGTAALQDCLHRSRSARHGRTRRRAGTRRGTLHRRGHFRRLRPPSQQESGVRLCRPPVRRARQPVRTPHPRRAARRGGARRRGLRPGQRTDEVLAWQPIFRRTPGSSS